MHFKIVLFTTKISKGKKCANVDRGWYPDRIMCDFEAGAINAAKTVYPNAIISGCLFHFGKAFFRKIQTLPHLLTDYNNNEDIRKALRCLQALAFVPVEYVYNYFAIVMSIIEPTPNLQGAKWGGGWLIEKFWEFKILKLRICHLLHKNVDWAKTNYRK